MAQPFEYNLPAWLRSARNQDSVIESFIKESEAKQVKYLVMMETLLKVIWSRGEFLQSFLSAYRKHFGDLPEHLYPEPPQAEETTTPENNERSNNTH